MPELNNSFLSFSPIWNQRLNESTDIVDESLTGPSLQSGTKLGLFSYLFDRWRKQNLFDWIRYPWFVLLILILIETLYIISFISDTPWVRLMFVIFFTPSVTLLLLRNYLLSSEKNAQLLLGKNREPEIKTFRFNSRLYCYEHWFFFKMDDEVEKERFFVIITRILLNWKCHKILMHNWGYWK